MIPASNLAEAMEVFEANDQSLYSVAWIDCLKRGANRGRSLVMLGEHASLDMLSARQKLDRYAMSPRRMKRVPFDFPSFAMSGPAVKAFNALYYRSGLRKAGDSMVDWDSYFLSVRCDIELEPGLWPQGFAAIPMRFAFGDIPRGFKRLTRRDL